MAGIVRSKDVATRLANRDRCRYNCGGCLRYGQYCCMVDGEEMQIAAFFAVR